MTEQIQRTLENIKSNNMEAYYAKDEEQVREIVLKIIEKGKSVACGGSVTLSECGIIDILKCADYEFYDRNKNGLTDEQKIEMTRKAATCDYYFSSANAITEGGALYNVDGNSNRVSAIAFGTKNVIIVAGKNKIVKNLDEAVLRVKTIAAPKNSKRLNCNTYCNYNGKCVSLLKENNEYYDGCQSKDRICCNYLISARQRNKNRIKVIIVDKELGF